MYGGPCVGGSVESPVGSDQDARGVPWVTAQAKVSLPTSEGQGRAYRSGRLIDVSARSKGLSFVR